MDKFIGPNYKVIALEEPAISIRIVKKP